MNVKILCEFPLFWIKPSGTTSLKGGLTTWNNIQLLKTVIKIMTCIFKEVCQSKWIKIKKLPPDHNHKCNHVSTTTWELKDTCLHICTFTLSPCRTHTFSLYLFLQQTHIRTHYLSLTKHVIETVKLKIPVKSFKSCYAPRKTSIKM